MGNIFLDYDILRIVVGVMFGTPVEDAENIVELNPSIPKSLLTKDFSDKVQFILYIKERIVRHRWRKFVDTCYSKILSSHKTYVTFVMYACIREHKMNGNIFEGFMSVCALLKYICFDMDQKTGVNLGYLNSFIFMEFYDFINHTIDRQGGVQRMVEFISDHRYLRYVCKDFFASSDAVMSINAPNSDLNLRIEKELIKDCVVEEEIDAEKISTDKCSLYRAKKVLKSCKGIEHTNLPRLEDVVKSMLEYRKKDRAERKLIESTKKLLASNLHLDKSSNSITESKTNNATQCQDNIEQYESIIQAVIRHNHSKSSGHESAMNKIQEEANGVLQHLKETIKKLTKVLNEFDED